MNNTATLPTPSGIDWKEFYERCLDRGPSYIGTYAASGAEFRGAALDIGCGALNDVRLFLDSGFSEVHALDTSSEVERLSLPLQRQFGGRFCFTRSSFDDFDYGCERYDLMTSNFSLAFREKAGMRHLLYRMIEGLRPAAIFGATFYGPGDHRKAELGFPTYTHEELESLLAPIDPVVREINLQGKHGSKHYLRVFGHKSDSSL